MSGENGSSNSSDSVAGEDDEVDDDDLPIAELIWRKRAVSMGV